MRYHRNIRQGYDPLIVKINTRKRDEGATQGVNYRAIEPILGTIPLDLEWDMLSIPCVHKNDKLFSLIGQDLTVSGGENGSFWDKEGKLVTGLSGGPRYTFDPAKVGKYEGVYVEVERSYDRSILPNLIEENVIVQSIGEGIVKGKDAISVFPDNSNNFHRVRITMDNADSSIYNTVILIKPNGNRYIRLPRVRTSSEIDNNPPALIVDTLEGVITDLISTITNNILIDYKIKKHKSGILEIRNILYMTGGWLRGFQFVNENKDSLFFEGDSEKGVELHGFNFVNDYDFYDSIIDGNVTRTTDTYTLPNLINPANPHTKFFIKNENRLAESYDPQSGQKTIYENGVQIGQEAYTSTDDFTVSSEGSDKYKCFAFKKEELTEQQLTALTAPTP